MTATLISHGTIIRSLMNPWQTQMNWASALTVTFGGTIYDDWRLPSTVDGPCGYGYDGTTTAGYNITSSEMGHLFYTELGNKGYYDTTGNVLNQDGDYLRQETFRICNPVYYWSGTEYVDDPTTRGAPHFLYGTQGHYVDKDAAARYALAVRPGDVTVVP